jgi:SPP1 gp7 family putative phage head morphogenesis protein
MDKKYSISTAFSLPAEEAIDYLKAKGYAISDSWQDLWQEAQDKAFSIAGVTNIDVLQDVRGMLEKSQKDGLSYGKFKEQLSDKLKARGWWGEKISINPKTGALLSVDLSKPHRLETIYRTNMQTSYNAGRYVQAKAIEKLLPYWEYVAVLDDRTRPDHSKLDGTILPADDPAWGTIHPPNGFNCRCTVLPRSQYWVDANGKQVSSSGTLPDLSKVPDKGWAYNPGASMWKPDLKKYDKDIAVLLDNAPPLPQVKKDVSFAAKTVRQAQKEALELNLADKASYSGISVDVANEWNRGGGIGPEYEVAATNPSRLLR